MTDYQILRLYRRPDDEEGDVGTDRRGVIDLPEPTGPVVKGSAQEKALFFTTGGMLGIPREKLQAEWDARRGTNGEAGEG